MTIGAGCVAATTFGGLRKGAVLMVIVVVGVFVIYLLFLFVLGYFCLQMVNDC